MQGNGEHAYLHHSEAGDGEPAQIPTVLPCRLLPLRACMPGLRAIAQVCDSAEDDARLRARRIEAKVQA